MWLDEFPRKVRGLVTVGMATVKWDLWKSRNRAFFDNIYLFDPASIITQSAHWLEFWKQLKRQEL